MGSKPDRGAQKEAGAETLFCPGNKGTQEVKEFCQEFDSGE
jgi:2-methylisocitrate lyase-like PEP mutase family enzyme